MKKIEVPLKESFARIRVIGIGGSGKNTTNYMIKAGVEGVEFIVANTDSQDLQQSKAEKKIHLGKRVTRGLGTGMNSALGRAAAEEAQDEITDALKGSDLVFLSCGMGGGTATGAAPVIAKIAKELGILTVAIVSRPFSFEGGKRADLAEEGVYELSKYVDSMVIIPNDKILGSVKRNTSMSEAFALSDNIHLSSIQGITELITSPGYINIDFADVKAILENSGVALIGVGKSKGVSRSDLAVQSAISSPLLETQIRGARKLLFSIASHSAKDISMQEVQSIAEKITNAADPNAKIIFGTSFDKTLKQGEIRVVVIATSFEEESVVAQAKVSSHNQNEVYKPKAPHLDEVMSDEIYSDDEEVLSDDYDLKEISSKPFGGINKLWKKK